jgi:hypothetical protein
MLKTKYFYDEEKLDTFREEYIEMLVHEKMMENPLLAGGSRVLTLLLIISLFVISVALYCDSSDIQPAPSCVQTLPSQGEGCCRP